MNCLICVKPFVKEKEFENYTWNPELCKSSISKLFGISNDLDVQGVLEDLEICRSCHECLENVETLMCRLEELQDRVNQARIIIKQVLVNSKEMSNPIVTSRRLDMSKSNLNRLALLKAIESRNPPPPPPPPSGTMDLQDDNVEDRKAHSEHFETINENEEEIPPKLKLTTVFTMGVDIESEHRPFFKDNDESSSSNDPTNSSVGSNTNTEADQDFVNSPNNSEPPIEVTRKQTASVESESSSNEYESSGSSSEESATESEPEEKQDKRRGSNNNKGSEEKSGTSNKSKQNKPGSVHKHFKLENGSFQCSQCFKIFEHLKNLRKHLITHSPPKFKCTWNNGCGKMFYHKSNLNVHIKTVHEKRRDFKCPIKGCGKRWTQKNHLDVHVRNVHKGARDFKCPMEGCGKTFASKSTRDVHVMGVHEGRRDFVCHVEGCGKAWASWGDLNKHIGRVHFKSIKKARVPKVSSRKSRPIPDQQI